MNAICDPIVSPLCVDAFDWSNILVNLVVQILNWRVYVMILSVTE